MYVALALVVALGGCSAGFSAGFSGGYSVGVVGAGGSTWSRVCCVGLLVSLCSVALPSPLRQKYTSDHIPIPILIPLLPFVRSFSGALAILLHHFFLVTFYSSRFRTLLSIANSCLYLRCLICLLFKYYCLT